MRGADSQALRHVVDLLVAGEPVPEALAIDASVAFARLELALADHTRALAREREGCARLAEKKGAHLTASAIRRLKGPVHL